jgi:hypothetical protein
MRHPAGTPDEDAVTADLCLRYPNLYAQLERRFVAMPDPDGERGWVLDLRDPFHPVVQPCTSWAAAHALCRACIRHTLLELVSNESVPTILA